MLNLLNKQSRQCEMKIKIKLVVHILFSSLYILACVSISDFCHISHFVNKLNFEITFLYKNRMYLFSRKMKVRVTFLLVHTGMHMFSNSRKLGLFYINVPYLSFATLHHNYVYTE